MTDAGPTAGSDQDEEATSLHAPIPGERRLARPPSDRYREAEARADATSIRTVSPTRGLIAGGLVALIGAALVVILGGILSMTVGLLVVAGMVGWATASAVAYGSGASLEAGRRAWVAAALAGGGAIIGQVGLWLHAGSEGGVLPLVEYLGEVYGPLAPLQVVIAPVVAWVTAR